MLVFLPGMSRSIAKSTTHVRAHEAPSVKAEKALPHGRTTAITVAGPAPVVFSVLRAAFTKEPLAWCAATLKRFAGMADERHSLYISLKEPVYVVFWTESRAGKGPKTTMARAHLYDCCQAMHVANLCKIEDSCKSFSLGPKRGITLSVCVTYIFIYRLCI